MDQNCWLRRTPLETGLLLVLVVGVPFLIALVSIYCVLLVWHCPECSMTCEDYCNRTKVSQNRDTVAELFQLDANLSLSRLAEKYELCSDSQLNDADEKGDHPYIASLLEHVYVDTPSNWRYKCAAAIITFRWVLSSKKCVDAENRDYTSIQGLYVRAGSRYWSKDGSVHKIARIIFAEINSQHVLAASELEEAFPKLPSIRPIMLSRTSSFSDFGAAAMCGWNMNEMVQLSLRSRDVQLSFETAVTFRGTECHVEAKNQEHVFCAKILRQAKGTCPNYAGYLALKERTLMGISIGEFCISEENATVNTVYDISQAVYWLETSIGAVVEFA